MRIRIQKPLLVLIVAAAAAASGCKKSPTEPEAQTNEGRAEVPVPEAAPT